MPRIGLATLSFVAACGCMRSHDATTNERRYDAVRAAVRAILDETPECAQQPEHPSCQSVEVASSGAELRYPDGDDAQRIMVVEGDLLLPSTGRYLHRIRGRYRVAEDGSYQPKTVTATMAKGMDRIWHEALSGDRGFVPASALQPFRDEFQQKFAPALRQFSAEHGGPILAVLAEQNPEATFYLADYPDPKELVCARNFVAARGHFTSAGATLAAAIAAEGVRFVNLSMGFNRKTVLEYWTRHCTGELSDGDVDLVLDAHGDYLRALSQAPGVVLVQAGLQTDNAAEANATFSPLDCSTSGYPNRIRVGYFNSASVDIPDTGLAFDAARALLPPSMITSGPCLDVFVNSGLRPTFPFAPGEDALHSSEEGIGLFPMPTFATSFAAPVALSRLMHLHLRTPGAEAGDDLAARLLSAWTAAGALRVQDPLKNEQLEGFRYTE